MFLSWTCLRWKSQDGSSVNEDRTFYFLLPVTVHNSELVENLLYFVRVFVVHLQVCLFYALQYWTVSLTFPYILFIYLLFLFKNVKIVFNSLMHYTFNFTFGLKPLKMGVNVHLITMRTAVHFTSRSF